MRAPGVHLARVALAATAFACAAAWATACNTNYGSIDHAPDDAGPGGDAALDGSGGDAAPDGPFCLSRRLTNPIFCDDFDQAPTFDGKWGFHATAGYDGGGVEDLDHTSFVSPPAALEIGVPSANPNFDSLTNRLGYDFSVALTRTAHFEADLRVDTIDDLHFAHIVALGVGKDGPTRIELTLSGTDSQAMVFGDPSSPDPTTHRLTNLVAKGVWTHVAMDLTLGAQPRVAITLGGATDSFDLPSVFATPAAGGQVDVGVGYYDNVVVAATTVHVDNVLLTGE